MDGVVVFIQCFGQHHSPTTAIKPHPVVYHILHRPYETLHNISVSEGDDVSDAFFLKKVFNPGLEGTVIITINGHRKTHFVKTIADNVIGPDFSFIGTTFANLLKMSMTTNPYLGSSFLMGIFVSGSLVRGFISIMSI